VPIPGPPPYQQRPRLIVELAAASGNWPLSPTWVDVTDRVRPELEDIRITRGVDDELDQREAGELNGLMLDNRDGALSAANPGSLLAGLVGPNQAIRLRAEYPVGSGTIYPVFQGQQLEPVFDSNGVDNWAAISAVDALSRLQGIFLPSSFWEQNTRNAAPKCWFPLSEKTESDSSHRAALTDATGNIPGFYVNSKGSLAWVDLDAAAMPFPFEVGPQAGATDFGADPTVTVDPTGLFGGFWVDYFNYGLIGSQLIPAGLGAGPGNMADPSRSVSCDAVSHAGVPASRCGGSFTILMTIQFQRGLPADPSGLFSQFDNTIADYPYKQLLHGAYVDGTNSHPGSNLGSPDFGSHPGKIVWVDQQAGWNYWTAGRVDDGRAHRIAFVWDAQACHRRVYIDGVLSLDVTDGHNGVYASTYIAVGLWRFLLNPANGANVGSSAATSNFVTHDRALTGAELLTDYQYAHAPGGGQYGGQRATTLLSLLGVPSGATNFDAGDTPLEPTLLRESAESALDYCRLLEQAEGGPFYANKSNILVFRHRYGRTTTLPAATFGDRPDEGELRYESAAPTVDQQRIRNHIEITRNGTGVTQLVTDAASIAVWGEQDYTEDNLPLADDTNARWRGQYLRYLYAQPQNRIRTIAVDPAGDDGLWQAMLSRGLDDVIRVNKRDNAGAVLLSEKVLIIKVDLTISRSKGWVWQLGVDPSTLAPSWLVLDDPVAGTLDSVNRLAW
jgi:hypothetical protein